MITTTTANTLTFDVTEVLGNISAVFSAEMGQVGLLSVFFVILLIVWIKGVEYYDAKKASGAKGKNKPKTKVKKTQYEDTSTRLMPTVPPAGEGK